MSLIELENVSRFYNQGDVKVHALENVSLRIEAGEMVAIMGASGSGKSTLMNLLGCLDKPSSGRLSVSGRDLSQLSPDQTAALRREVFGFVFQRYHLLPHLSAVGNVELPAVYAGQSHDQRQLRAIELLQRLGLGERLSHKPNMLSGGQQQRVSIARALMNGGEILLADEPTGALDSTSGAEVLALLSELNGLGHTVIIVTHDASVAAHARRVIELSDGRVAADVTTLRTDARPNRPTVASGASSAQHSVLRAPLLRLAPWREAFSMSLAALSSNRLRSALSMLGISIGIAAVVTILTLSQGVREMTQHVVADFSSNKISASKGNLKLAPGTVAQSFTTGEMDTLRDIPGVTAVEPSYSSQTTARFTHRDGLVNVAGINVGDLSRNKEMIAEGRDLGRHDLETGAQIAVINRRAQEALFPPGESALGQHILLGELSFTVIGISESKMPIGAALSTVYVPHTTYTDKIDTRHETDVISIHFAPSTEAQALLEQVRRRLRMLHGNVEDFSLEDGQQARKSLDSLQSVVEGVLTGIASISLLVGGVGVMNIMLVSVAERTREIGIRIAVGARKRDIRRQFLIETVVLCCIGGLVGLSLPALAVLLVNAAPVVVPEQAYLNLSIPLPALALAMGTCTAIGLLFGILPANHASRLSPVVALARD